MRRDDSIDERFRALELSTRPLSAFELEEHQKRMAFLKQDADDRWTRIEQINMVRDRAFTALERCKFPPAKTNNGIDNIHRQLPGQVVPNPHRDHKPCPLDLANEDLMQRQSLYTRRDQRGYLEFEVADQKRRAARMGLGGQQSYWEGGIPQMPLPIPMPETINHLSRRTSAPNEKPAQQMRESSKGQEQRSETPAYGQWIRERTKNLSLMALARQEVGQRKLIQQKHEQHKVELPTPKPGNLYPGPTRIASILPTIRTVHDEGMVQSNMPETVLSMHLKAKEAAEEAMLREEEEQHKAAASDPYSKPTGTESVKQLLVSVNKALEQKVEAAEIEAVKTDDVESEALRARSQPLHKGLGDAYEASLKCGETFWDKYDKVYPIARQPDGTQGSPSLDSASEQPLAASPDHAIGADESARPTGLSKREVPLTSSPATDLRAAVEAINKTSGHHLESPKKTASAQDEPLLLDRAPVSTSLMDVAAPSLLAHQDSSIKAPRPDVSPPPTPHAEQTDTSSGSRADDESVEEEEVMEAGQSLGDVDVQLGWEEVDGYLGDEGWSDVEEDLVDEVYTRSVCSEDAEWADDVVELEGAF